MYIFRLSKLHQKKYIEITWVFDQWNYNDESTWKQSGFFCLRNYCEKSTWKQTWIFRPATLYRKNYMETTWIFWPGKLHWKTYVETTWIFRSAKLRGKKYVKTTWIFRSAKLHWKSSWKWRRNSSKFVLQRIDVISTLNRRGFDVVCPLGLLLSVSIVNFE